MTLATNPIKAVSLTIDQRAKDFGLEVVRGRDYTETVQRLGMRDAVTFRVRLPATYATVEIEERELHYGSAHLVDHVDAKLAEAAAAMRGHVLRELLDGRRAIDFVGESIEAGIADPAESKFERAERLAIRLAEESDKLMRLAGELRNKETSV